MLFAGYFCHRLRAQSTLMSLVNNQVTLNKRPEGWQSSSIYVVVGMAEGYDPGNHSTGTLTTKQESFTILIVGHGKTIYELTPVFNKVNELIEATRAMYITLSDAVPPVRMWTQCVLLQNDAQYMEGMVMDGNEQGDPCFVLPCLASFDMPIAVPP